MRTGRPAPRLARRMFTAVQSLSARAVAITGRRAPAAAGLPPVRGVELVQVVVVVDDDQVAADDGGARHLESRAIGHHIRRVPGASVSSPERGRETGMKTDSPVLESRVTGRRVGKY